MVRTHESMFLGSSTFCMFVVMPFVLFCFWIFYNRTLDLLGEEQTNSLTNNALFM